MRVAELLDRLEMVKSCGKSRWIARCPAHPDRHPSLAVAEGERGLLIRCWAGCRLEEVTRAVGLSIADLFFDHPRTPDDFQKIKQQRALARDTQKQKDFVRGLLIDTRREAEKFLALARNPGLSGWTNEELHDTLNVIADAYEILYAEKVECGNVAP